jgi:hypothetical protein
VYLSTAIPLPGCRFLRKPMGQSFDLGQMGLFVIGEISGLAQDGQLPKFRMATGASQVLEL